MQNKVHTIKPLTRGLPKTGDVLGSIDFDDGYTQRGWWLGRTVANNKTRFVEQELVSGENVIADKATGLMWVKDITGKGCNFGSTMNILNTAVFAYELEFGGYTDWFIPNFLELVSLFNAGASHPCSYVNVFTNWNASFAFWTSTHKPLDISRKMYIAFDYEVYPGNSPMPATHHILPCRLI